MHDILSKKLAKERVSWEDDGVVPTLTLTLSVVYKKVICWMGKVGGFGKLLGKVGHEYGPYLNDIYK